jgi:hypothetical protein
MSKPRDPILAVLNYFTTTELPLAEQALSLAKEIVAKRRAGTAAGKPTTKAVAQATRKPVAKKPATKAATATPQPALN